MHSFTHGCHYPRVSPDISSLSKQGLDVDWIWGEWQGRSHNEADRIGIFEENANMEMFEAMAMKHK
jgi:hypothetical protein